MSRCPTDDDFIDTLIDAAERHHKDSFYNVKRPDEDPGFGFGDLEIVLRECWKTMDAKQRALVASHFAVVELVEEWNPLEVPPPAPSP